MRGCPWRWWLTGFAVLTSGSGSRWRLRLLPTSVFPKEDSGALSRLIARLVKTPEAVSRIAARSQEVALRDFSFDRMMERWVATLRQLHEQSLGEVIGQRTKSWSASRPGS